MIRPPALFFGAAMVLLSSGSADAAKPKKTKQKTKTATVDDKAFKDRFASLKKSGVEIFVIRMAATDDPAAIPGSASNTGLTLVGNKRQLHVPELLSPTDIQEVVQEHLPDVKKCFKKQLEADPEWNDDLILDLAIKKSGRVSEVSIAPNRVKKDVIGACMMSEVPKWKFPEFTGETGDGVTQDVVTASFPFSMSPAK